MVAIDPEKHELVKDKTQNENAKTRKGSILICIPIHLNATELDMKRYRYWT